MTAQIARSSRTRIKFCGITTPSEAELAFTMGADAIGAILAPSPRSISLQTAREIVKTYDGATGAFVAVVGSDLSNVPQLCNLGFTIQFAAPIAPERARALTAGGSYFRVFHVSPAEGTEMQLDVFPCEIPLFDTARAYRLGGTGRAFRWARVVSISSKRPVVVAGGLDGSNVADCIREVRPFGVDVRSGIESDGKKSASKMRAFVRAVRSADAATHES